MELSINVKAVHNGYILTAKDAPNGDEVISIHTDRYSLHSKVDDYLDLMVDANEGQKIKAENYF